MTIAAGGREGREVFLHLTLGWECGDNRLYIVVDKGFEVRNRSSLKRHGKVRSLVVTTTLVAFGLLAGCAPSVTPASKIEVTGSLNVHDPALIIDDLGTESTDDDVWYIYSTGDGAVGLGSPQVRQSVDQGVTWKEVGPAWTAKDEPYWARSIIEGVDNFWAPEVYEHDGTYYMYYSASTFGSNTSLIGLYTNTTLDPEDPEYRWVDRGEVLRSDGTKPFNAIDPGIVEDSDGKPWMVYGSFWQGLFMVPLEWPSGKLPGVQNLDNPLAESGIEPIKVADRGFPPNAIEAGFITQRDNYYYLFFSKDSCCQGTASTYNIAVGRSENVTGPYVDADGRLLTEDGGTQVLETTGTMIGPGGQSVANDHLAFHFYDQDLGGQFQLGLRKLTWTQDGWPVAWTKEELAARQE